MLDILSDLLLLAKEFDKTDPNGDIEQFKSWLIASQKLQKHSKKVDRSKLFEEINRQHSHLKMRTKAVVKSVGLSSIDDYYYLLEIQKNEEISKSRLITNMSHEMPTGSEIIKRLLKKELITQKIDPRDKRVKILELRPLSVNLIHILKKELKAIENDALGTFSDDELYTLLYLLQKLHP